MPKVVVEEHVRNEVPRVCFTRTVEMVIDEKVDLIIIIEMVRKGVDQPVDY